MKTRHMWVSNLASFAILSLMGVACTSEPKGTPGDERSKEAGGSPEQTPLIQLSVTSEGFVPAEVKVKAGQPVKLVVTRQVERTCATDIVIKDFGIKKALPLQQPVEVDFTPAKTGKVRFACAMDMIAGVIIVE
jgi:plastocyanin domain-containing protein